MMSCGVVCGVSCRCGRMAEFRTLVVFVVVVDVRTFSVNVGGVRVY